jgi:uncharacterized RDD family membrane protein YckC
MSSTGLYCSYCGQLNDAEAEFCSRCGARQKPIAGAATTTLSGYAATGTQAALSTEAGAVPPSQPTAYTGAPTFPSQPMYAPVSPSFHGYGGFWIRVVAALIDGAVTGIVLGPVFFLLIGLTAVAGGAGPRAVNEGLGVIVMLVIFPLMIGIPWIYSAAMESSKYQATLGKMALGLKVTDLYGNRISFLRATGRHFGKMVSGMVMYVGFIMVGLTQRKQGLHDMLAGTLVVKK